MLPKGLIKQSCYSLSDSCIAPLRSAPIHFLIAMLPYYSPTAPCPSQIQKKNSPMLRQSSGARIKTEPTMLRLLSTGQSRLMIFALSISCFQSTFLAMKSRLDDPRRVLAISLPILSPSSCALTKIVNETYNINTNPTRLQHQLVPMAKLPFPIGTPIRKTLKWNPECLPATILTCMSSERLSTAQR